MLKFCIPSIVRDSDNITPLVKLTRRWHLGNTTFFVFPKCVILKGENNSPYWGTLNSPPLRTFMGGRFRQGQPPFWKIQNFWTEPKSNARPPEKTIALAFLEATYPQIPHWVHFTFKVQNPMYIFTFIE